MQLVRWGLGPFELQVDLRSASGAWIARVDFLFLAGQVVGEADGLSKYDHPEVLRAEKLRQELLANAGYPVVRWGWRDLLDFGPVARRIRRAQARGAQAPGAQARGTPKGG